MKNLVYILILMVLFTTNTMNVFAGGTQSESEQLKIQAIKVFFEEQSFNYIDVQYKYPRIMTSDNDAKAIDINSEYLSALLKNDILEFTFENYPVSNDEKANIRFTKSKPAVGIGTCWIRKTANGEIQEPGFEPIFYVGKIEGEQDSKVTLFLYKNDFYSVIERTDRENFSISPTNGVANKNIHILTSQPTSLLGMDYNPFLDLHFDGQEEIDFEQYIKKAEQSQSSELLQADIIIEATNDFFKLFNNYDKTAAYISAVMTHSTQIFESNVIISLFVPMVVIHEDKTLDPYKSTTQIFDRLNQVRENWRTKTVKRALVCLLTDIDYQGGSGGYRVGGVSLGLGTLCKNNQAYCVFGMQGHYKYPTSNYTWDVSVSAHEMGHAFGAPHTHNCYFRPNMIDTCITKNSPQAGSDGCVTTGNYIARPGTLMSYCHLTNPTRSVGLYFHDRVKPIIRGFSESATCLKKATDPTLILLNPIGGTTFFPGDKIAIRWAFSNVETVAIKYSLDNGKIWHWIETYADAKNGYIMWTVPDSLTSQVLFHISDSYNAYIYDQLINPCSIDKPHFAMKNPGDGARLGQNENYKITWDQKFISAIKIEFTSESNLMLSGGQPEWFLVHENINGFDKTWTVPEIISENCMLRLTGITENGGEFVIYSGKFAIGKAYCEILAPKPGDKICANTKYDIQWQSDFVTNLYIQFSTDGGSKWRHIFLNAISGALGKYSWSVPSNYSDNCIFRISQFENKNLILDEQNLPFSIDSCETSLTEFLSDKSEELSIIDITPNPANAVAKLKFEYKSAIFKPIDILVLNSKGEQFLLQTITPEKYGENVLDLELGNLAQGNYFIVLQSGNSKVSKNLIIIK